MISLSSSLICNAIVEKYVSERTYYLYQDNKNMLSLLKKESKTGVSYLMCSYLSNIMGILFASKFNRILSIKKDVVILRSKIVM